MNVHHPARIADLQRARENADTDQCAVAFQILDQEIERELAAMPVPQFVYAAALLCPPLSQAHAQTAAHPADPRRHHQARELVGPGALGCVPGPLCWRSRTQMPKHTAAVAGAWLTDSASSPGAALLTVSGTIISAAAYAILPTTSEKWAALSHREVLDWLAVWFRDDAKGSLALHRLILTSTTYRQQSDGRFNGTTPKPGPRNPIPASLDADNRLLARMNRTRLTGEMIRDAMLQMSGRLDLTMGGPAAVQFRHQGAAKTFMPPDGSPPFVDYENFDSDARENRRRAIYRFVFRTVPDPLMETLDCPDGGAMTPVRSVSTTLCPGAAQQRLLIRQCEHIAARLRKRAHHRGQIAAPSADAAASPADRELASFTAFAERHAWPMPAMC